MTDYCDCEGTQSHDCEGSPWEPEGEIKPEDIPAMFVKAFDMEKAIDALMAAETEKAE